MKERFLKKMGDGVTPQMVEAIESAAQDVGLQGLPELK